MTSQYRRRSLMLNTIAKVAQGNPTIITDSSSRRLQKLNVYGQSEQDSTTGAQLFDILKATPRTNTFGLTVTIDGDYILINGSVENLSRKDFRIINTDVSFEGKICKAFDVTTTNCSIVNLVPSVGESNIVISLNVTALENISCKFKLMVSDTESTSYEPYTGGKPSPSHDYPQEIISKEISEIKVTNGADLSQTITLTEPITLRGIPVDNGGNVTIDGQQYISDYIDSVSGKINRLIGFIESYNEENVGDIYMSTTGELSIGATVIYKLDTPTQEDLPKEQEIKSLKTFYPNTVINTGCWNEVTYSAKRGG